MAESDLFRATYDPTFAANTPLPGLADNLPPLPTIGGQAGAPEPPIGFDETTRQVYVNGSVFDADDHQAAIESERFLDQPVTQMPANFRPMGAEEFGGYIRRIREPSLGRLIKKNVGIGVDISQELAGSALKFLGAEETGQAIVAQQEEDLRRNQPYQRTFTGDALESPAGAGEWFVANAAQLAPLAIEFILTSFAGGAIGGAVGVAAGGAKLLTGGGSRLLSLTGRKATAETARTALKTIQAGGTVKKGSAGYKALRTVGRAAGSAIGGTAAGYGVGIGDIYGEMEATGTSNRLIAALAAIPYALSEVVPGAAAVVLGARGLALGSKAGRLRRGGQGAAVGGAAEGSTEVAQDLITLAVTGQLDLDDPEIQDQLINAFAAGAGIGAPIGGVARALGRTQKPVEPSKPPIDVDRENADLLQVEYKTQLLTDRSQEPVPEGGPIYLVPPPEGPAGLIEGPSAVGPSRQGSSVLDVPEVYLPGQDFVNVLDADPLSGPTTIFAEDGNLANIAADEATRVAEAPIAIPPTDPSQVDTPAAPLTPVPAPASFVEDLLAEQRGADPFNTVIADAVVSAEAERAGRPAREQERRDRGFQSAEDQAATQRVAEENLARRQRAEQGIPQGAGQQILPLIEEQPPDFPVFTGVADVPMIDVEHRNQDTGEVVMLPVPVREALAESEDRLQRLLDLRNCLFKKR